MRFEQPTLACKVRRLIHWATQLSLSPGPSSEYLYIRLTAAYPCLRGVCTLTSAVGSFLGLYPARTTWHFSPQNVYIYGYIDVSVYYEWSIS